MRVARAALFAIGFACGACGRIGFDTADRSGPVDDALVSASLDAPGDTGLIDGSGRACMDGGAGCGAGEYCVKPIGMCSAAGTCEVMPAETELCAGANVCGCDGRDYLNSCVAARAGQSLISLGPCEI